jgi:hypothetical protein
MIVPIRLQRPKESTALGKYVFVSGQLGHSGIVISSVSPPIKEMEMRTRTGLWILVFAALVLTPLAALAKGPGGGGGQGPGASSPQYERGQRDFDRDRLRDRDRIHDPAYQRDQVRDQDRTNAPEAAPQGEGKIYGAELMSEQERNQYREQVRLIGQDPEKMAQFKAQHREEMQKRAKVKGVDLDNGSDTSD